MARGYNEGSVYQRQSDGRWCVSVRLGPGKRVTRYASTRLEATRLLQQLVRHRADGKLAANSTLTVGQWLDEWLALRQSSLRPKTHRGYESAIRVHLRPALGHVRLSRLAPLAVEHVINDISQDRPHMALLVLNVLRMACAHATRGGLLSHNPVEGIPRPRVTPRERNRWSPEQTRHFLRATQSDRYRALWAVLIGSGMRVGEALGLEWTDLDLDARTVHINRSLSHVGSQGVLGAPKTRAGKRTVALPGFAVEALRSWRATQARERLMTGPEWRDNRGSIFTQPDGSQPTDVRVWRRFQSACRRAGVPRMRVHDLRHVHASLAIAQGADPKSLQVRLGHASLSMTLGVYAHRVGDADRRIADSFDVLSG